MDVSRQQIVKARTARKAPAAMPSVTLQRTTRRIENSWRIISGILGHESEYCTILTKKAFFMQRREGRRAACKFKTKSNDIVCNADMYVGDIRQYCRLQDEGQSLMRAAMTQLNLSACAYHRRRSVKLARAIADLAGSEEIQSAHLAEPLYLRSTEIDVELNIDPFDP